MEKAIEQAKIAFSMGEVPVGCVIVDEKGEVIGTGYNTREKEHSALGHAEINAIKMANKNKGDWRLEDCTIFVTLEPCPMCTGAIINARIGTVVFGAREEKFGSIGSVIDLFSENYNHKPRVYKGVLEKECKMLMLEFFKKLRK